MDDQFFGLKANYEFCMVAVPIGQEARWRTGCISSLLSNSSQ